MYDYRGTFIVESVDVRVIPAWRVKREKLAEAKVVLESEHRFGNRGRHRA